MQGWLCESCKCEVGKDSMIECSPGGRSQASHHKNTLRVPIYCAGQVRGRLIIVCGAPRPAAWRGNNSDQKQSKYPSNELLLYDFLHTRATDVWKTVMNSALRPRC